MSTRPGVGPPSILAARARPPAAVTSLTAITCLAACLLAAASWSASPATAHAQDWSPPYCGGQPRITSVYDHEHPDYASNGTLRLYSGADVASCARYDGHSGWDFARATAAQRCVGRSVPGVPGDLIFAAEAGTVHRSRWDEPAHDGGASAYGLYLDIDHGGRGPLHSLYGHLAAVFVEEGQAVQRGQLVGALGTTGNSTGPHLHFSAARGSDATVSRDSFDVYGWCNDYGSPSCPYPGFADPHRGNDWSRRVVHPTEAGPGCPGDCGRWIVDDDAPTVSYRCSAGVRCPSWYRDARGYGVGHHWTRPNGPTRDYYATYACPACGSGWFLVEAFVPEGGDIANTHVARYQIGDRVTIVDQHEEGGVWHPIGMFHFRGYPIVELNDRTDRYDYTAPGSQKIGADALRFTRPCCCVPPGTPSVAGGQQ